MIFTLAVEGSGKTTKLAQRLEYDYGHLFFSAPANGQYGNKTDGSDILKSAEMELIWEDLQSVIDFRCMAGKHPKFTSDLSYEDFAASFTSEKKTRHGLEAQNAPTMHHLLTSLLAARDMIFRKFVQILEPIANESLSPRLWRDYQLHHSRATDNSPFAYA